jgi:hypothetical protein
MATPEPKSRGRRPYLSERRAATGTAGDQGEKSDGGDGEAGGGAEVQLLRQVGGQVVEQHVVADAVQQGQGCGHEHAPAIGFGGEGVFQGAGGEFVVLPELLERGRFGDAAADPDPDQPEHRLDRHPPRP